jgi:cell division protein FtsB
LQSNVDTPTNTPRLRASRAGGQSPAQKSEAEPLRRKRVKPARSPILGRRTLHMLLVFTTIVLLADALIGEKGLTETMRARREYQEAATALTTLRAENAQLRENIRSLNEDPSAIEAIARRDLGLMKPDELVFIITDAKTPK